MAAQASEIDTIENKLTAIKRLGHASEGHFVLAQNTRVTDYHDPMETLLAEKSKEWAGIPQGLEVIEEARHEIAIYRKFSDYYGDAFFVMKRPMEQAIGRASPCLNIGSGGTALPPNPALKSPSMQHDLISTGLWLI